METEKNPLGNNVQPIEIESRLASFPIVFNCGTRKENAYICFSVPVTFRDKRTGEVVTANVESAQSRPFIVMTNQKQWENCAGLCRR